MRYNPERITPEVIAQEINGLGFQAVYIPEASSGKGSILEFTVNSKVSTHNIVVIRTKDFRNTYIVLVYSYKKFVFPCLTHFVLHG